MAAYPVLPTSFKSDPNPIKSINIDRAEDGTGRACSYFTADKHQFRLGHQSLTTAQKTTLDNFYTANRLVSFDYLSPTDGITRTCLFGGPIDYEREDGDYWSASVSLEQV